MKQLVILASGSGSNAENIVKYFEHDKTVQISHILTNNPKAGVIERANRLGIPCKVFTKKEFKEENTILNFLINNKIDLIILAGFLWLVPVKLVRSFHHKIINIHPALLPKYGGKGMYGNHIHQVIVENKEEESGITIHYVNEKYDDGDIILQKKCSVLPSDSANDVARKVHQLEYKYFPKVIEELLKH
ncbi:phosphoribosylglycinamide formyltransferase [Marinilabiliaceae bacterium JC017]|nr:phosphoribosylglycinamide formyltransferase [Marinilabiliaceae bacterium JC017]